jgi:hypothetical protein
MTIRDILTERYLVSDFTFGFEYEAYIRKDKIRFPRQLGLEMFFEGYFPNGAIGEDLSIRPPNKKDYYSFEYKSPILQAIINNFQKLIQLLEASLKFGIETNESCGFHTHIGFPKLNEFDTEWSLCQIALDNETIDLIKKLGEIRFNQRTHAQLGRFVKLASAIKYEHWIDVTQILSNKTQILYAHPQGTIEWRGPRNFIQSKNIVLIKEFIKLLHAFILRLSYLQTLSVLGGKQQQKLPFDEPITKKLFAEKLGLVPPNERLVQTFDMKNMEPAKIKRIIDQNGDWLKKCSFRNAVMRLQSFGGVKWISGEWIFGTWQGASDYAPPKAQLLPVVQRYQ